MRSTADQRLFLFAVAVSLALTGVTVWAVARQGQALQARQWADLENAANAAAAQRTVSLRGEIQRALDTLGAAWEASGAEGLDRWVTGQSFWLLAVARDAGGQLVVLPRTPLEEDLPAVVDTAACDATEEDTAQGRLSRLRELASNADPLTQAGALFAVAVCERQLGHPLDAAGIFADVAHLLRTTPGLARFAFRAEVARVESLWSAGDSAVAQTALLNLLRTLEADHPARIGPGEITRLAQLATTLNLQDDEATHAALQTLQARSAQRSTLTDIMGTQLAALAADPAPPLDARETLTVEAPLPTVIAARQVAIGIWVALATPRAAVLERYWGVSPGPETPWRVRPADQDVHSRPLARLGPEFGGVLLDPSPQHAAELRRLERRRVGLLAATATGSVGAWAVVIWMMARAIGHQRELLRLQRRFVADVSHELKTPLALIRLLSETLAEQRIRDPERTRNYLETIIRESERLSVLLDSILDFSRMESGKKEYQLGDCDIGAVARQAWALFEPQFQADGFDARIEITDGLPIVRADPQAMQQVMVNLLQNAHRYAGEQKYVRLRVHRDGYLMVITVEDRGIGMSRGDLQRLGNSFVRGDDTRVRQMRGAGLGLTIVNHIVHAHHGKLEVYSRPGHGSTFTVWIPFEPPPPAS